MSIVSSISTLASRKLPVVTLKSSPSSSSSSSSILPSISTDVTKICLTSSSSSTNLNPQVKLIYDDIDETSVLRNLSTSDRQQQQQLNSSSSNTGCILDDSLTSLTWLQNLNLLKNNGSANSNNGNNSAANNVVSSIQNNNNNNGLTTSNVS